MSRRKKSSRKVRVPFKKNRSSRARQQNVTHEVLDDERLADQLSGDERLTGKGDVTRYRTVLAEEQDGQLQIAIDEAACLSGRVISAIGSNSCVVATADGAEVICTVRKVVRAMSRDGRSAVVAGDRVQFQQTSEEAGVIERVEMRDCTLSRGSGRFEHIIAANIRQFVIVSSAAEPSFKPQFVDRCLVSAERGNLDSIICINKVDLVDPVGLQQIAGTYARLGYEVILASATTGRGIAQLKHRVIGRETVFAGQSGVGKSSLLNEIEPGLARKTSHVSHDSGKGRHTTRTSELINLAEGGIVVDTPGIRQLELWDVIPEEVEGFFIEFRPFVTRCKFPDCSHTHESSCGVKQAVDNDLIAPMRYENYVKIITGDAI